MHMARLRASYRGERRTAHFGLQLTPSERAELERRARVKGVVLAEFVRACCFLTEVAGASARSRLRDPDAMALVAELGRVGNNLNQLARHANQTGEIGIEEEVRETIAELKAALSRIV